MKKKKSKSKKKKKKKLLNYKMFAIIGGLFHLITYFLYDLTFYNNTLFWLSLLFCGLVLGIYFIKKMDLLNPKSYRKIKGFKLKIYMFFVCLFTILGTSILFGNVINGTILGLNYIGKNSTTVKSEHTIQKIEKNSSGGRRGFRRSNPKVYLTKEDEIISLILKERYNSIVKYSEFKTIELNLQKGMFGFEIIDNYELIK